MKARFLLVHRCCLLLILLVACNISSYSQCSLHITRIDCRDSAETSFPNVDTVLLYRVDHGHIKGRQLLLGWWPPLDVDSLSAGDYRLAYTNIYGQRLEKRLTLKEQEHRDITLCVDSMRGYSIGVLDIMEDGDWLRLQFQRSGCSGVHARQIAIDRIAGRYRAKLYELHGRFKYNDRTHTGRWRYKRGELLKEVWLDQKQISDFTRFENELHAESVMGCTTTDHYTLTTSTWFLAIDYRDGSCSWSGYDHLELSLFNLTEEERL